MCPLIVIHKYICFNKVKAQDVCSRRQENFTSKDKHLMMAVPTSAHVPMLLVDIILVKKSKLIIYSTLHH